MVKSTLGSYSQSTPSALSVGDYPSDWSLFDTGDPAPGNPFAWGTIHSMWQDKAQALDTALASFHATGQLAGEGYKVRYLNESLGMGSEYTSKVQAELMRMGEVAQEWARKLIDVQSRAKEAHRLATQAQEQVTEFSAKVAGLSADLELTKKGPERADAQKSIDGFRGQLGDAQQVLEQQRQMVRDLASEYRVAADALRGEYVLVSGGDLASWVRANHSHVSFALRSASGGSLFDGSAEAMQGNPPVSGEELLLLSQKAADDPEALKVYLQKLALLSPAELADFAGQYPDVAHLPVPVSNDGVGNAQVVRDWWNADGVQEFGLSSEQREVLIAQLPGFVGNLEGVRYADRDRANRVLLDFYVGHPELTSEYAKAALERIRSVLAKEEKGVPRSLINLDLTNMDISTYDAGMGNVLPNDMVATDDVLTSIALGDLDGAEAVTITNPGMKSHPYDNLNPDGADMDGMAQQIYNDQNDIYRLDKNVMNHAVIINLNYVTPQGADVLGMGDANRAAERNANSIDALNVVGNNLSFEDKNRKIYMWNHSYGSTTAGQTIQKVGSPVEAYYNVAGAGWGYEYFENPDAADLEYLAKDSQDHPQMYSTLANADNTARWGETGSGRFDPRALKNSFEISAEASKDGRFAAAEGHIDFPQDGVGYNTRNANSYRSGIFITTDSVERISPDEIVFNPSPPQPSLDFIWGKK